MCAVVGEVGARAPAPPVRRGRGRIVALLALLATALGTVACDAHPRTERRALRAGYFDSTGSYVHAGVSTRTNAKVPPLRPSTLGADTTGRAFELYRVRCGSCHEAPDPAMKSGEHWSFLVPRMQGKTRTAGLVPMTDAEADTILGLLRRHGRR